MSARQVSLKTRKTTIAQIVGRLFVGGMVVGAAMPASALNCTWNPATGNWGAAGNWSCVAVPGAADSATIAVTKTVTIDTGQSILNLTNAGSVNIDQFGLNLVGGGSTINTGTINVGGGITANLGVSAGHNINNTGGVINVANGSVVNLFGSSTITGGTIATTGTGSVDNVVGTNTLNSVTLNGRLNVGNNTAVNLVGTITNNGNINIQSVGNVTDVRINGATALNGSGSVSMSNNPNNRIVAANGAGDVLTVGAGQTIQGSGQIGAGGLLAIVNNGTLLANQPNALTLSTTGAVTNNSVIRGDGAAFVISGTNITQSATGTLNAINNGVVQIVNSNITGGTFTTASGGAIATANGTGAGISGVTNSGTLNIVNNSSLQLNGTLTNNGAVNMQSVGNFTDLRIAGAQLINGTGTINLSNNPNNRIFGTLGGDTLTLGSGQTLQGSGAIGNASANFTLVNQGTIVATQSNALLIGATGSVTNTGTLRADGGALQIQTTVNSIGGSIQALNGSQVQLLNGAVINNANFSASGGGLITTVNGATVTLGGGTVNGPLTVSNNSFLRVTNDVTYNGTLSVSSVGNFTDLSFSGTRTLSGAATVQMSNNVNNRINSVNGSGDSLTTGANITIQGSGTIGGNNLAFTNGGTVIATQSNPLLIQSAVPVTNSGVMRADGGTLQIQATINSGGGSIEAVNGSQVQLLNGTVINNANFSATGAGSVITTVNGASVALAGGNLNGALNVTNNSFLRLDGNVSANGSINLNSVGNFTDIQVNGSRSLSGPFTINMSNNPNNRIVGFNPSGDTLTLANNVTVQGAGQIGGGGALNVVNNGLIIGNQSNNIAISTSGSFSNNGTIRGDGNAVVISATTINQTASGVLNAINSGAVVLTAGTNISGGSLTNASGGVITTANGNVARLTNVTNSAAVNVVNNSFLDLAGTLTNNGSVNVQSVGNFTDLRVTGGAVSIGGTGTINFSNNPNNRLIALAGTDSLTLGSGQTLQGAGQIGAGGQFNFTNNGTIIANAANSMTIDSSGTLLNNNIIRADAANLTVNSASTNLTQSGTGVIQAINGGTVTLTGNATFTGGTLSTAGGGVFQTANGNVSNIANLTNNGTFNVVNNSFLTLTGTIINNGALNVNSVGNFTDLRLNGNVTLGGTGTTTMSNASVNRISAANPGDTLTIGAGQTLQGSGQIGSLGSMNLINLGTITANQSNALNIQVAPGFTVTNQTGGLMQSNTNGTLNLGTTVANNGTIAANGGVVNATAGFTGTGAAATSGLGILNLGAASTVGTIQNNGTSASALNLGANNITVSSDYQNANFGTGNSFNARQNVAGAGQILAAGTPATAQVITGANVTNGGTIAPTLTIGNVRVGNNAYTYDVANNNAGGPAIRGAIQTAVGGANINDARLTGSGVTAGNFGPVAAAGSQTFNVNFNAASAGLLAPLAGQVARVANNFDNVAEQNISIQLAAGAAAFNLAQGSVSPNPTVTVANQRILGNTQTALTVTTGPAGAFTERLNASFGANSGAAINNVGTINLLAAGASNNSNMSVGVNTATAGAKTGTQTINYQSDGTGTSGLSAISAGSQTVTVNGNVYQVAQPNPSSLPASVSLGNFRAGAGAQSQTINITNTNAGALVGFQEGLAASIGAITGTATGSGFTNAQVGASGALQIGLSGIAAGNNAGSVQVQLQSNGITTTGSNGLGSLNLGGSQTVNVTGTGWRLASANAQPGTINFGNVLQNSAQAQFLNIQNTAIADGFSERLGASFLAGGTTGSAINNGGTVSLLAAGASNNAAMSVGVNTATLGAISGQVIVAFNSNGAGTSGLGITGLPNQNIGLSANVTGVVGTLAQPSAVSPNPVNFGNFRVGAPGAGPQNLSISNGATVGEGLNASIATSSTGFTAAGAFNNLAPTLTNNTSLQVSFNGTGSAGAKSGTATVTLVSDGTFNSGVTTALPSQTVNMTAGVFNVAQTAGLPATVNVGSFRTSGSPVTQNVTLTNTNISPAGFQEGLNATIVSTGGAAVASGALNNVAAGASGNLVIGVTGVAGLNTGTVQVQRATNGTGTSGLGTANLGGAQTVNVTGLGYTTAQATVQPSVNFGIVHVGDVVATQGVSVQNSAPVTALNDTLRASIGGATGPFTSSGGPVAGLTAGGAANTTTLRVGLNTAVAGVYNSGTATVGLTSQNPDLSDLALAAQNVALNATVNKYANADFHKLSGAGAISRSGNIFTLDFGTIFQGSGLLNTHIDVQNLVGGGPADLLSGILNVTDGNDFTSLLLGAFGGVGADAFSGDLLSLTLNSNALALGVHSDDINLTWSGSNTSGYLGPNSTYTLHVVGNIIARGANVPEPGTLLLMTIALAGFGATRRRKAV